MATRMRPRGLEIEPLNLTPLLDILFNLIFFFVLATTIKEDLPAMKVSLPESKTDSTIPLEKRDWIVTVSAEGQIFLNDDAVTSGELKTRLTAAAESGEEVRRVRIRLDRQTPAQFIIDVMGIARESKHPNVSLDIKRVTGKP